MRALAGVALVAAVACGGDGPGPSPVPSVGGRYIGSIEPSYADGEFGLGATRLIVTQTGHNVTAQGQLSLTTNFEIRGTVDTSGVFTGSGDGIAEAFEDAFGICGEETTTSLTIRFRGLRAAWDETAETEDCGDVQYTGTLER